MGVTHFSGPVTSTSGFNDVNTRALKFACGTYIGTGQATVAIKASGLTTIAGVYMSRRYAIYAPGTSAIRGDGHWRHVVANGTPGSFYPLCYRSVVRASASSSILGAAAAATVTWFAWGT